MRSSLPGFAEKFTSDLQRVPAHIRERINRPGGLNEDDLVKMLVFPQDHTVSCPTPPEPGQISVIDDEAESLGKDALFSGKVAFCILAGGAGTRVGGPKAMLRIPGLDMTLLTLKLFQAIGNGPIWIVVSPSLKNEIENHVSSHVGIDVSRISYIEQYDCYRLTPDNQIFFESSEPSLYPCGHGDLFPALTNSNLVQEFLDNGGRYISIVNVDNVKASLDARIVGHHIRKNSKVTCEVVQRNPNDSGGVICDTGTSLQVVESFRLGDKVDINQFEWLNTNSFTVNANLDFSKLGSVWHRVRKIVDERIFVQHERMLQEITAAYDTDYVAVDREDRFMPIKNQEDLEKAGKILSANHKFL